MKQTLVLYYDGDCGLCSRLVQFVLKRNSSKNIYFAPLQGNTAKNNLSKEHTQDLNTVVFSVHGKILTKSKAVLTLLGYLDQPWSFLAVFKIIPTIISNIVYDLVAKNRKQLFSNESCLFPSADEKHLFLE
jgi:predicted DCC family thiol-disulfide oxidoreductase YuxK